MPLGPLLARAGDELADARAALGRVEAAAMALLPAAGGGPTPPAPAGLQDIDRLAQVLDDLGRALMGLAGALPPEARVAAGALTAMRMGELRARLLAPPGAAVGAAAMGPGGHGPPAVELF